MRMYIVIDMWSFFGNLYETILYSYTEYIILVIYTGYYAGPAKCQCNQPFITGPHILGGLNFSLYAIYNMSQSVLST
jgi:hypothetical protein